MEQEEYPRIYLYRRVVQAKLFIDQFYFNPIDLRNIAGEANFSKFHFIRLFKKIYGRTPHQYLTWVRIEHAKLLLQTKIGIGDVCFAVGFESNSSFTGLFKRMVGSSPSVYQQQQYQIQLSVSKTPLKHVPNCFAETQGWVKDGESLNHIET
jgi:AraC-like DNA-binding protein